MSNARSLAQLVTTSSISLYTSVSAGGTTGSNGQYLQSTGTGVTWSTVVGGVSSIIAGTGITISGSTGAVTISNSGVTSLSTSGIGISLSGSTGAITLSSGATSVNTANTIVSRDSSGNFTAGTITGTIVNHSTGSAGSPSITFTGNTNTGVFSPGSNTIAVSTNGTEALRVDSSGNLGLGVVPSAWGGQFKVYETPSGFYGSNGSNYLQQANNAYFDGGSTWRYKTTGNVVSIYEVGTGGFIWRTAPSGTAGNAITFTQAMTLDATGKLGIGTASPSQTLHVVGNARITGAIYDSNNGAGTTGQVIISTGTGTSWSPDIIANNGVYSTSAFFGTATTITQNHTVTTAYNEMSVGPVTVQNGITVTVNSGAQWTVV